MISHGNVPMFKMKPHMGSLIAAIVVLLLGIAFYFDGHRDPGNIPAHNRAKLILTISIVISGLLLIVSTARMWFAHLHHDRYKNSRRKNNHRKNNRRK